MSIACQLSFVRSTLPEDVTLVAVSKTHPVEAIREAYDAGHRVFGESRPQELREKYEALPQDIEWHMIGHLQTNKIKYIAPFVSLIHSVDSARLAEAIQREAAKCLRPRRDGHCDQYRRRGGYPPGFHGAETLFRPFAALFRGAVQRVVDGHVARLPLRRRVRFEHGARRVADFRGEGLREVNGEAVRSGRGKSPEVRRSGIINGGQPE